MPDLSVQRKSAVGGRVVIGIVKSSLPDGRALDARQALEAAARQGLGGLLFNSLYEISPTLDIDEMRSVRRHADELGLYISASLGVVNPALPFRCEQLAASGGGDLEAGVRRLVALAAAIGIHDLFFVIGMIEDRFNPAVSWQAQRDGVAALIIRNAPLLRSCGSKLLIKTHEEITTAEILALVEMVGSDVLGVAFDPVNVLCRMEDPLAASRRIAPYTAQIHIDDAIVRYEEGGIRRFLCPLGEGVIDWTAITAEMPKARQWIEMHSGQFGMPVFDSSWLAQQPGIRVEEFASVMAMAHRFGTREMVWDQTVPTARLPQAYGKLLK
jgi:sugar phosphate isomerase/epimerase